jgi:hypothetical protein
MQFTLAYTLAVCFTLSKHYPAHETILDHAIRDAPRLAGAIPAAMKRGTMVIGLMRS